MVTLDHALAFLRSKAREAGAGTRLATVKALAAEAGVSHYTLSKALAILAREGVLSVRARSGITVREAHREAHSAESSPGRFLPRWRQIALAVSRRIRSTAPRRGGDLILPKSLCAEFGVTYPTARKALDYLVEQAVVQPQGRGFVAVGSGGYGGLSVLYVSRRWREFETTAQWRTSHVFAREFERTCSVEGVPFEYGFVGWKADGVKGAAHAGTQLRNMARQRMCCMAVVPTAGIDPEGVVSLCDSLSSARVPIVPIVFQPEPQRLLRRLSPYRLGVVNAGTTPRAGPCMADFLVGKGYRKVAVVASKAPWPWQEERIAGLTARLLERSGEAQCRLHWAAVRSEDSYDGPKLSDSSDRWAAFDPLHRRVLRQHFTYTRRTRQQYLHCESILPVVKVLLEQGLPDVVVGINDDLAIACLDAFASLKVRVPEDCAVVGFDDSPGAFAARLTSYNHNWHVVAREILRFGMTCAERTKGPALIEAPGAVVERLTTA